MDRLQVHEINSFREIPLAASRLSLLALAAALIGCGEPPSQQRNIVQGSWDTIFAIGAETINDSLFAGPTKVVATPGRIIVVDEMESQLKAFDPTGRLLWAVGSRGEGPEQFDGISDIAITPDSAIWVLDFGNGRIGEYSLRGEFLGVRLLHHLPSPPTAVLPLDEKVITMSHADIPEPFMELERGSLALERSFALPWPDSIPPSANTRVELAGTESRWLAAYALGPGFMIWDGQGVHSHRYFDWVPFALKVSPELRAQRADSARWGAVSLSATPEEIFVLFGGRPRRRVHPGEPTRWIDVYGWDGEYRRSYRLPFDADAMATDGRTFYLLTSDLLPMLVALRNRGHG